ncbi:MAG TPA: hypothetical protein VNE62_11520 [Actinomycetota bacterium]|nr:hypothetical protein [Actinomycetota bacterium]
MIVVPRSRRRRRRAKRLAVGLSAVAVLLAFQQRLLIPSGWWVYRCRPVDFAALSGWHETMDVQRDVTLRGFAAVKRGSYTFVSSQLTTPKGSHIGYGTWVLAGGPFDRGHGAIDVVAQQYSGVLSDLEPVDYTAQIAASQACAGAI